MYTPLALCADDDGRAITADRESSGRAQVHTTASPGSTSPSMTGVYEAWASASAMLATDRGLRRFEVARILVVVLERIVSRKTDERGPGVEELRRCSADAGWRRAFGCLLCGARNNAEEEIDEAPDK